VWAAEAKALGPHRNGQAAANEPQRLEEIIMQTVTPDRTKITETPCESGNKEPAID